MKRDVKNGKVSGVCAGIAKAVGVDVTLLRVLCLVGFLVTFPLAEIAYVAFWALLPTEE